MEARNLHLQQKYSEIREKEVRYETLFCDDAELLVVAFGSAARLTQKAIEMAREEGLKVGLLRPITLWPFPSKAIAELAKGSMPDRWFRTFVLPSTVPCLLSSLVAWAVLFLSPRRLWKY